MACQKVHKYRCDDDGFCEDCLDQKVCGYHNPTECMYAAKMPKCTYPDACEYAYINQNGVARCALTMNDLPVGLDFDRLKCVWAQKSR